MTMLRDPEMFVIYLNSHMTSLPPVTHHLCADRLRRRTGSRPADSHRGDRQLLPGPDGDINHCLRHGVRRGGHPVGRLEARGTSIIFKCSSIEIIGLHIV